MRSCQLLSCRSSHEKNVLIEGYLIFIAVRSTYTSTTGDVYIGLKVRTGYRLGAHGEAVFV